MKENVRIANNHKLQGRQEEEEEEEVEGEEEKEEEGEKEGDKETSILDVPSLAHDPRAILGV